MPVLLASVLVCVGAVVLRIRHQAPTTPPVTMEQRAVAYLTAISESRAEDALAMSATEQEGPFLTSEALRASMEKAPISDIAVSDVTGNRVTLSHRVNDQPSTTTVTMVEDADGWKVDRAATQVRISPKPEMIPLTIDGIDASSDSYTYDVLLFPGQHTLSTGSRWLEYSNEPLPVTDLSESTPVDAAASVTDAGVEAVRSAVSTRLQECVETNELAPERCPWSVTEPDGQPIDPASVTLAFAGDPMAEFTVPVVNDHDALATGRVRFTLKVSGSLSVDGAMQDFTEEVEVDTGYKTDLLTDGPDFIWTD